MSLINQVLKDLDRQGSPSGLPGGVHAIPDTAPSRASPAWPWAALALAAGGGLLWFILTSGQAESTDPFARSLHMAEHLSLSTPAAMTPEATPPTELQAEPGTPQSDPAATETPLPAPARAEAGHDPAPSAHPAAKLDRELAQPAVPPPVVKAQRPLTPAEQAEETYHHALSLIQRGRAREAANVLATALRLSPTHLGARQAAVALALEMNDRGRAETLIDEGLGFHRGEPWFYKSLGQLQAERGDYARAADTLLAGLPLAGGDPVFLGLAGGALARAQRHGEAARLYTEALGKSPGNGPWWIGLGLSLEQLGRREEAAAAFRQARQTRLSAELSGFVNQKLAELAGP